MKCGIEGCTGEYRKVEVTRAFRKDDRVVVIDHIPAEVCSVCGEMVFSLDTLDGIQRILAAGTESARTAPVFEYKDMAVA